jgi:hypothetical protein
MHPLVALFTIVGKELQIRVIQPPRPLKAVACVSNRGFENISPTAFTPTSTQLLCYYTPSGRGSALLLCSSGYASGPATDGSTYAAYNV